MTSSVSTTLNLKFGISFNSKESHKPQECTCDLIANRTHWHFCIMLQLLERSQNRLITLLDSPLYLVISSVRRNKEYIILYYQFSVEYLDNCIWYDWFKPMSLCIFFIIKHSEKGFPSLPKRAWRTARIRNPCSRKWSSDACTLTVEAAAHPGVSNSWDLHWCVLVWRRESLEAEILQWSWGEWVRWFVV